ncbi:MAG: branched-chain amino acid ABC transporter permease [Phycisphaerales bacterium]|nr:branched-chain amino acid ABC transporter permease [Phycisphaerales bacterium]
MDHNRHSTTFEEPLRTAGERESALSPASLFAPMLVVVFALAVHFIGPMFGDYTERVLLDCAVAIVAAVSLNIVNGFTGQFSIGHAAFMAVGGYTAAWISYYLSLAIWKTTYTPPDPEQSRLALETIRLIGPRQWILLGAALVGGLVAAGAGWLVGLPSLRLRGDYLAIVTLGFGEILRVLLQQTNPQALSYEQMQSRPWIGFSSSEPGLLLPPAVGGALGFTDIPKVTNLFWAYLFVGAAVLFSFRLKMSSYGRAMISIREDEIAAEAMGVNVTKLKVRAFMFAAFFAGIAGALYAHQPGTTLRPIDAGFLRSFEIVIMVVLGGLGSISGAILAAIIITVINALLLGLTDYGLLAYRMPTFALVLILLMIFRPQGLFGIREVWDFFGGKAADGTKSGHTRQPHRNGGGST